jgi:hypothetical protein
MRRIAGCMTPDDDAIAAATRGRWAAALRLVAAGLAMAAVPAAADVARVPVDRAGAAKVPAAWRLGAADRNGCIDPDRIAGAMVLGSRTLEVVLRGGSRYRLVFAANCPQLGYYGGFYYKRGGVAGRSADRLCAGRDRLQGREGGTCPIDAVITMRQTRLRHR